MSEYVPSDPYRLDPDPPPGAGSLLLNIIWLVLSGIWLAATYVLVGILLFVLIVTIPFGLQCFKLAGFALWPFGRAVIRDRSANGTLSLLGNIVWLIVAGLWMALAHLVTGVLLCLTVIGIPLGLGNFKMVPLVLTPFGHRVVPQDEVDRPAVVYRRPG